ncbi:MULTISPECIES: YaiI/YqxD family protein [Eubacteriales]|uniref:UPF0178 protein GT747_10165 n=1 Tax=Bittarella massiliensis (ex Durand et al. 2017) TaxID=1720313 RepID=A0AAQ1MC34_9FIRM|nr:MULTISPECIES: DUF188 domain-containing protein [Eubacteriales]MZL70117.1 hypothetical protein [Bittarella massiliensis (ex Durand et al. 2017)]MZL81179.1 hypothetical protein [Bittarella massiliensis (ex Durand et al. 2017)]SHF82725.1 hypothetical protein SAMN05444424_0827 [Bittarella massiliensis (ex Durand et al. 2017)]
MRVRIDADACPVTRLALALCRERGVAVTLYCDTAHQFAPGEGCEVKVVSQGADAADYALVGDLEPGDIAVTQDYGVAAMALAKRARALNQNGLVYTDENLDGLLMSRHLGRKVRRAGGRTKGPKKRTAQQDEDFCRALEGLLDAYP